MLDAEHEKKKTNRSMHLLRDKDARKAPQDGLTPFNMRAKECKFANNLH